jgi:NADH dehydrogenase
VRVLVVGGTGYVGQGVVPVLRDAGHEVSILARHKETISGVEVIRGDGRVLDWRVPLKGTQAVVNLVGIIREHRSTESTFQSVHVDLVKRLLAAMQSEGVSRLIQMSALGSRRDAVARYHQTKWMAEEEIHRTEGLSFTILRPSLVFGSGSPFFKTLGQLAGTPLGAMIPGSGDSRFDPVFRGDLAHMVLSVLEDPQGTAGETFELGGPERWTLNGLVAHVAQVKKLGPVAQHHLPLAWLNRMARIGEGFSRFPVTVDQLTMLAEDNITEDRRWHQYVEPTKLGIDL